MKNRLTITSFAALDVITYYLGTKYMYLIIFKK